MSYLGRDYLQPDPAILSGTSSPDGVVTATKGTLYTDRTTGVTWKNQDGASRWEPSDIPDGAGAILWDDFYTSATTIFSSVSGGSSANVNADPGNPGIRRATVTAVGDGVTINLNNKSDAIVLGAGRFWSKWLFRVPTISDGTNNLIIRLGAGDASAGTDFTDGIYLEYDFATYSDHNWRLCAANNGTRTKTDTGIALTASSTTMTSVLLMVNADGTSLTARINGVLSAATVTTNIPTGAGRSMGAIWGTVHKQLGSGALTFDYDGGGFKHVLTTPRMF